MSMDLLYCVCCLGLLQNWHNQLSAERVNSRTEGCVWLSSHSIRCVYYQVSESP